MKITQTDLHRFSVTELRMLFRLLTNETLRYQNDSAKRQEIIGALKVVGRELARRSGSR